MLMKYQRQHMLDNKVVTLDGNIVNVGGSLTGGTVNRQQSSILQKRELRKS